MSPSLHSLNSLVSYVETYGDEDLVVVFLGDHQAAPLVTGDDAGRRTDHGGRQRPGGPGADLRLGVGPGLRPGPQAPVWPMDAFRDRFLAAFGRDSP